METIKPAQQGMGILLYVLPVPPKHAEQELVLCVSNGLDDEAIVPRKVEKGPALSWGSELGEDVLGSKG